MLCLAVGQVRNHCYARVSKGVEGPVMSEREGLFELTSRRQDAP